MSARDTASGEITALLAQWSGGDRGAVDRLVPLIYAELRRIAARQLRKEPEQPSLDPTDLVHALFVRLVDQRHATWQNRAQFFAVAARLMRRILVDLARTRLAAKRGGTRTRVSLTALAGDSASPHAPLADVLEIDRALERLAERDPDQVRIIELRLVEVSPERSAQRRTRLRRTSRPPTSDPGDLWPAEPSTWALRCPRPAGPAPS